MENPGIIKHAEWLMENVATIKFQAVAKRNGIRWTDQEFVKMAVYAELHDIPPILMKRVRKFENGGAVYPYGQHNKRDAVVATTPPKEAGMHQAAITLRTALFEYMLSHPEQNEAFLKRNPLGGRYSTQEYYFRMHQDDIVEWLMFHGINPRLNKMSYASFLKSKRW